MRTNHIATAALLFFLLVFGFAGQGQIVCQETTDDELAKKAAKILAHDVGTWDCEWSMLDADGKVAQTVEGVEIMVYSLDKKIIEITTEVPTGSVVSKSMRFYNSITKKLTLLSVGADGNHWEIHQDIDSDVMVSTEHLTDGKPEWIRFTTIEKTDDMIKVTMERSLDNKTWTKVFDQKMVRRKSVD